METEPSNPNPEEKPPGAIPAPKQPEKEPSLWKKFIDELSYDIPFSRAIGTLFLGIFIKEGKAVKSGWFAFFLFTGLAFWGGCHYSSRNVDEQLSETTNYFNGELDDKNSEVDQLKGQLAAIKEDRANQETKIQELTTEKESTENKLTFFEANPDRLAQIYSRMSAIIPTNVDEYLSIFSQFSLDVSNLSQFENGVKTQSNVEDASSNELAAMGIQQLPDGRVKIGGMVSGSPTILIKHWNAGLECLTNGDFHGAFSNFEAAIKVNESSKKGMDGVYMSTGDIMDGDNTARLYANASRSAMGMGSNDVAYEYAKKAEQISPDPHYKMILIGTSLTLGEEKTREGDWNAAFVLFDNGITNYENLQDLGTNGYPKMTLVEMYREGAGIAAQVGKTTEVIEWASKQSKLLQ